MESSLVVGKLRASECARLRSLAILWNEWKRVEGNGCGFLTWTLDF
jgi:hypothetical protein